MWNLITYIWQKFIKPFESRLFVIFFFLFFIPVGPFGIYYKYFSPNNTSKFLDFFTPETIFTFTVPLMASIFLDGIITSIHQLRKLDGESGEFELFRDSLVLGAIVLIIQIVIIYNSISKNNAWLSILSVLILWFYWIILSGTKIEFSPEKGWKTTGNADTSSADGIDND